MNNLILIIKYIRGGIYSIILFKVGKAQLLNTIYTMTDIKLDLFLARYPPQYLAFNLSSSILQLSTGRIMNSTKIYIGYLPVSMNEATLREVFQRHCQVVQVIIKKGNAQGHFDKFCYGFVTVNGGEKQSNDIIAKITNQHPNWKLKIKEDGPQQQPRPDKFVRPPTNFAPQQQFPPPNMYSHIPQQIPALTVPLNHQSPPHHQHHQGHQGHQGHQTHQQHQQHQHQQHQSHQPHHMQQHQQQHPQHHHQQHHQHQNQHHQPQPQPQPHQSMQHHQMPFQSNRVQPQYNIQQAQNDKGQIYGEKKNRIMVRQLWLGGIPQMIDHGYMTQVMTEFGLVQATQIFPKFAFVKFKRAIDAAIAFQRASRIFDIFGQNSGFRISFSDPSRRKQIVGNHYQFQRNSVMLPVLFLGFPPITSANVDIHHMMSICEKFGTITNYYMKKSTNTQMRSYILFTYDNLKNALRAKQQLCRRKDLLGQKRVQITLLLQQQSVTKGRDFTNTQRNFSIQQGGQKSKKPIQKQNFNPSVQSNYNSNNFSQPLVPGNYQNMVMPHSSINHNFGYSPGQYGQQQGGFNNMVNYPPPSYEQRGRKQYEKQSSNNDVLDILHSVYDDPVDDKKKGPTKRPNDKQVNASDIISQMLDKKKNQQEPDQGQISHDSEHGRQNRQPNWSGFITWKGNRRTGVDGFAFNQTDFSDYSINVNSLISNDDVILKEKANMMVLEPTNSISQPIFNEYLKVFRKKTGISVAKNWLIYLIGKNSLGDSITPLKDNQILIVMEKVALIQQLKDKVLPCNESYFE